MLGKKVHFDKDNVVTLLTVVIFGILKVLRLNDMLADIFSVDSSSCYTPHQVTAEIRLICAPRYVRNTRMLGAKCY